MHSNDTSAETINTDVVIVGGGACGTYAAVRLRDDYGVRVTVIEEKNRLGGHADAVVVQGVPINLGLMAYLDRKTTQDFFARFNIPLVDIAFPSDEEYAFLNVDLTTGVSVEPAPLGDPLQALAVYFGLCVQYYPYVKDGYFLPPQGPYLDDLTMPFGEFLKKYEIEAAIPIMRQLLTYGDALGTPTMFMMGCFGLPQLTALNPASPHSMKFPATGNTQSLFEAALAHLGEDVLLNSTVLRVNRDSHDHDWPVTVQVKSEAQYKTVRAKKILVTVPPTLKTLQWLDLRPEESSLFDKWNWETLYVGAVGNTGLQPNVFSILGLSSDPGLPFYPKKPFVQTYMASNLPGIYTSRVIGDESLKPDEAQRLLLDGITKSGGNPDSKIVAFGVHSPTCLVVSEEELKNGFFEKMYHLQGQTNTWWTGLAWAPDYSSILWDFTETLLPQIVSSLEATHRGDGLSRL
ncbi:hypothetical protein FNYG_10058 [Fusarium nygamai]|uniref:Amine oxidase domain-containing protein n=1 Tax=Gibberella nygamai TaxID=42673 RepID=A0A2K0W2Y7_GIBNY|nr:hypothetical protein FNYG_10058 [Fusarium nygamai]